MVKECRALRRLRHDNVLQFIGILDDSFVTECGRGEELILTDLCQYLQDHVAETSPIPGRKLRYITILI